MVRYKKRKDVIFEIISILFLFFSPGARAETSWKINSNYSEVTAGNKTDKSINLTIHKSGAEYTLRNMSEIIDYKFFYADNYQEFKGGYDGVAISFSGKKLGYFSADMRLTECVDYHNPAKQILGGCSEIQEGEAIIATPYFSNGKYVDFYNPQGEKVLTVDLSSVAVCDENNICDATKENEINCPSDCNKQSAPVSEIQKEIPVQPEAPPATSKSNILVIILTILFSAVIIVGGVIFWRRKKDNYDSGQW